jgi:hypothetical protein
MALFLANSLNVGFAQHLFDCDSDQFAVDMNGEVVCLSSEQIDLLVNANVDVLKGFAGEICTEEQLVDSTFAAEREYNDSVTSLIKAGTPDENASQEDWDAFWTWREDLEDEFIYNPLINTFVDNSTYDVVHEFNFQISIFETEGLEAIDSTCVNFADGPSYYEIVGICGESEAYVNEDGKFACGPMSN